MSEAQEELVKDLRKRREERTVLLLSAKHDQDRDLETYQTDMIEALDKALNALETR